ncbi:MAG TPA: ferritin-like protein [Acetobacteraceae bacterium]|nr:ferritin-like protein [Acetobacteraceae bacterium]
MASLNAVAERPAQQIGHLNLVYHPIEDLDHLRATAQLAIEVEFTTIPAYLSALYSLKDVSSDAYQVLRSVVVEEMFHMNQAANLLIGIGGKPLFTGRAVPRYPTYLPSARKTATPYVGLFRASQAVFEDVFMAIETPAPWSAPAEGRNYQTIAQLYRALEEGIERCVEKYGAAAVFKQLPDTRQRDDIYIGKFGGRAVEVRDLDSARFAILQIVQQGEGAVDPTRTLVPEQPFGAYQHYGMRLDGTYGPILGTPFELSHYFKFKGIAEKNAVGETYPSASNPRVTDFTNPKARDLATLFNKYYSVTVRSLEQVFAVTKDNRDVYFEVTLPLMHAHLPRIARSLVTTPMTSLGDPVVGPNAAPTFEFDATARMSDLIAAMRQRPVARHAALLAAAVAGSPATADQRTAAVVHDRETAEAFDRLADELVELQRRAAAAGVDL